MRQFAAGGRCARAETNEIKPVHADEGLAGSGWRGLEGRQRENLICLAGMITARHGQHHVGCCGDDRLIRQRLVTVDLLGRIDAAGHCDDRRRLGILARRHHTTAGAGKHEEHTFPALFRHRGDILRESIEPGFGFGSQCPGLVGKTDGRADILDLLGDGIAARRRIDGDERHRTCLEDGDDIRRAGAVF